MAETRKAAPPSNEPRAERTELRSDRSTIYVEQYDQGQSRKAVQHQDVQELVVWDLPQQGLDKLLRCAARYVGLVRPVRARPKGMVPPVTYRRDHHGHPDPGRPVGQGEHPSTTGRLAPVEGRLEDLVPDGLRPPTAGQSLQPGESGIDGCAVPAFDSLHQLRHGGLEGRSVAALNRPNQRQGHRERGLLRHTRGHILVDKNERGHPDRGEWKYDTQPAEKPSSQDGGRRCTTAAPHATPRITDRLALKTTTTMSVSSAPYRTASHAILLPLPARGL